MILGLPTWENYLKFKQPIWEKKKLSASESSWVTNFAMLTSNCLINVFFFCFSASNVYVTGEIYTVYQTLSRFSETHFREGRR